MVILALETATRAGSLAMIADGQRAIRAGQTARTHSERLPQEIFEFLADHQRPLAEIDVLAVVSGPGSFTGLRIGLAAIQGMAMTGGKRVVGVPTLEAMAAAWSDATPRAATRLATCLDGARGDVFLALFGTDESGNGSMTALMDASVAAPAEAARVLAENVAGGPVVITGDGALKYRDVFTSALPAAEIDDRPPNLALGAALLARHRISEAVPPHALRPLYVRRPDAVLARERAQALHDRAAEMTIARATTPEDLAEVAELQRRSFANAWGAEAIRWELDNTSVARLYAVRAREARIVAYCACWVVFDELHINSVAVEENLRRQGVARRLLQHVFEDAIGAGVRVATLEVRQSNTAARRLYESLGFRVEGVRRNYYQDPREDALILWHRNLPGQFAPR